MKSLAFLKIQRSYFSFPFIILILAGLNTVLRPSADSDITLFRLFLPLSFAWFLIKDTKASITFIIVAFVFTAYSIFVSLFVSRFGTFNLAYNFHYLSLIFFYFFSNSIIKQQSAKKVYFFCVLLFKILITLGIIQFLFGGVYFNTQDRNPAVNIFFWNENEYSAVLSVFLPLYFLTEKSLGKYFWSAAAIILIAYNHAQLALLALMVFFFARYLLKIQVFNTRFIGAVLILIAFGLSMYFLRDYAFKGEYTLRKLTGQFIENFVDQTTLPHVGSVNSRTNAILTGLKEIFDSGFFGIGPGNSILMIRELIIDGTEKWAGLSMHNFFLQIITETGYMGFIMILFFMYKLITIVKKGTRHGGYVVFFYYLSAVISITIISAPWSNYFCMLFFFYSVWHFEKSI